ncbi:MAG: YihY/virulence factor BrkB family protein [Lachnospiraceae bacterium]|nr:YihY/virulence factor BrkB family protein [Lachnospiraceae bacterium]
MIKDVSKILMSFGKRCGDDHMGAYAATCAYFLILSFVPFFMIVAAVSERTGVDMGAFTDGLMAVVPSGLKDYVSTIIMEVNSKTYIYVPLSILILIWSAAKFVHALSNGLNVISRVKETRGWFFLRIRSMLYVVLFMALVTGAIIAAMYGQKIQADLNVQHPFVREFIDFIRTYQVLFAYLGLIFVFVLMYTVLPNCHYTMRSQLPGALIVSTVWMFFSYLISLYYEHNQNFTAIYGSLTGIILSMIWMYFCCYFLLIGAELNRLIFEDPEGNLFVSTIDAVRDARVRKAYEIEHELDEYSVWKPIHDEDEMTPDHQPADIYIPWEDEDDSSYRGGSHE